MIKASNITISLKKERKVVENLNFILNDNDKLAIIGEEGNGKSTLVKFIYDYNLIESYCNATGSINVFKNEIGYLPQMMDSNWNNTSVEEYFLKDSFNDEIKYERYNDLYKIEKLFNEYELDINILNENRLIKTLSGGEKIKLQLIKIFMMQPKLYLFDEPTNDIDLQTIEIIERFMLNTTIPIIFISHDEMLLSNVANMILHLEQIDRKTKMKFTIEKVNYQEYVENRFRRINQQNMDAYRTQKEKERKRQILMHQHQLVENHINAEVKNPANGRILVKKMRNILAQEKKLEKMQVIEYADVEEEINLFFDESINLPSGKTILNIENYDLVIYNKLLSTNINLKVKGQEHITIIGSNGVGKSTLLKHILKILKLTSNISVGYMPQNYDDMLNDDKTPVEYLQQYLGHDKQMQSKIMTCLGALNFVEYEMKNSVKELSGGQKAKLFLLQLVLNKNNVLVLDEPTRNLSPLSNPVIRNILKSFKGTIISVSHDRKYIFDVSARIYELNSNGFKNIDLKES